jgi:nitrogen permease regulator 2-like protein
VIHQVPEDSIVPLTDSPQTPPLVPFSSISRFLIPHQSLCGNLISLTPPSNPPCLILSYPICLKSPDYARNEFIFNFALVLSSPETIDVAAYKAVVTKLAHLMQSLEEQSRFLSSDTSSPGSGKIYSLCEMLMEDLNNYCECMIPIDELNTLNIKLFPTLPNPPSIKAWHVPLFTVQIGKLMDENWDLTMQRIIPFIDGVRSVKKISRLADADLKLTKKCVKHLLYYGCVLLLDIFTFNGIYAPTADFEDTIVKDVEMQRECARYVNKAFAAPDGSIAMKSVEGRGSQSQLQLQPFAMKDENAWPRTAKGEVVDGVTIVLLFAALRQGLSVRAWYGENSNLLANIDMRRFITFGVIKGFLHRIHRYAIATESTKGTAKKGVQNSKQSKKTPLPRSMSSELHITEDDQHATRYGHEDSEDESEDIPDSQLARFLDGNHCFDEICTEFEVSEAKLMERIRRYPSEVVEVNR